ncbi:TetR/AcrR family transcriptional regulator [Salinisphaera sp. Q1T1-3]|uniref:TetR/AcrR family transcriptional regulator n=1 Tax=Salinisphaera sp. Q1T1-3 TaxID=2321229 RepID=UPI000E73A3FB|nr:TetR/AcrR family transcriptional regulator [Salinisphaera sp. Q1T1-3]RJS93696.1 TetR/AcrR family transcriptional regulator [Salinisphaera sp. Q1T1-3]
MARRSDHSREELRDLILGAAEQLIVDHGLGGLSARAIARRVGYTPGTIYLVFTNLDDVILHVNARTLDRLRVPMAAAVAESGSSAEQLRRVARAYAAFAQAQPNLWRACFEHRLPDTVAGPDYIDTRIAGLVALIMDPLAEATGATGAALDTAAQALWSGVHGICMLTLTGKLHMVGGQAVAHLTDDLVSHYLAGVRAEAAPTGGAA